MNCPDSVDRDSDEDEDSEQGGPLVGERAGSSLSSGRA